MTWHKSSWNENDDFLRYDETFGNLSREKELNLASHGHATYLLLRRIGGLSCN